MKVTKQCQICEKMYQVQNYRAEKSKFCSHECRRTKVTKKCEACKGTYQVQKSISERSKFCSRECQSTKVTKRCQICETQYQIKKSAAEKSKFCSRECHSKAKEKQVTLTCKICGSSFQAVACYTNRLTCCSKKCRTVSKSRSATKLNQDPEHRKKTRRGQARRKMYKDTAMRSQWEVIFAAYLDHKELVWKYEPESFPLKNGKTYIPDFWVEEWDEYVEVKPSWRFETLWKVDELRESGKKVRVVTDKDINEFAKDLDTLPLKTPSITNEQVLEVSQLLSEGVSTKTIIQVTGVSRGSICGIRSRSSWAWLTHEFSFPDRTKNSGPRKLKEEDVVSIRNSLQKGVSYSQLAVKFNVSVGNIDAIHARRTWKHVT